MKTQLWPLACALAACGTALAHDPGDLVAPVTVLVDAGDAARPTWSRPLSDPALVRLVTAALAQPTPELALREHRADLAARVAAQYSGWQTCRTLAPAEACAAWSAALATLTGVSEPRLRAALEAGAARLPHESTGSARAAAEPGRGPG